MSAQAPSLIRSFRVGKYTVTLTVPPIAPGSVVHMLCEWEPDVPSRLSKREWREYRAGRDAAFAELAQRFGINVLSVDL